MMNQLVKDYISAIIRQELIVLFVPGATVKSVGTFIFQFHGRAEQQVITR
jgi:hypothetical protein